MRRIGATYENAATVDLTLEDRIVRQWAWLVDGTGRAKLREEKRGQV